MLSGGGGGGRGCRVLGCFGSRVLRLFWGLVFCFRGGGSGFGVVLGFSFLFVL